MAEEKGEATRSRVGGEDHGGSSGGTDWVPRPDPTTLTTAIVDTAKADLRRELAAARELIEERFKAVEAATARQVQQLDYMPRNIDKAVEDLHVELDRRLAAGDVEDREIREEIRMEVTGLERLHEERFTAIAQQFTERDVRGEQEKKSSKEALDAALLAQKESVSQQNDANTTAATKSETSFTKQIDQIGTLIATLEKSLTDRITELKERIDRGEGGVEGGRQANSDRQAGITTNTSVIYLVIASIAILVSIAVATHGFK